MHKPLGFEVMHFILYVRVWLHQGVPVEQSLQQGYGRCCRMTRGEGGGEGRSPEDLRLFLMTLLIPPETQASARRDLSRVAHVEQQRTVE